MEYVYDVIAFLDRKDGMPHYPRYRVIRRKVGSAASLEAARAIIDEALRDGYVRAGIHHFVVEKWPAGVYHGGYETLAEYSFGAHGELLESRDYPYYGEFMGRKPDEYRFADGDLCEVWSEDHMCLVGEKTGCRGYPLSPREAGDRQIFYISGKKEPRRGKEKRGKRYTVL